MDGLTKKTKNITTLMKHKNTTLKFFGLTTIMLGVYVVYLGSRNDAGDRIIDVDFNVVKD